MQRSFPAYPCFEPESLIEINLPSSSSNSSTNKVESFVTRKVMAELNCSYESAYSHSFTESLLKHCSKSENITSKESALDKKRKRRNMQRSVCAVIAIKFTENAALNFLSESESFSGNQRKRIAQSFEQVETPKPKSAT